jgi:protease II
LVKGSTRELQYFICDAYKRVLKDLDSTISQLSTFRGHINAYEQTGLITKVKIYKFDNTGRLLPDTETHIIDFPTQSYSIVYLLNQPFNTNVLRFRYFSLIAPSMIYSYNMGIGKVNKLYPSHIPGRDEFDYVTRVIYAQNKQDPTGIATTTQPKIPITIAYKKNIEQNGCNYA